MGDKEIILTLNQYLDNPTMMNRSSVLNLSYIRKALDDRYNILISKNKTIKHEIYKNDNKILIHFHLPSESYELNYDVLIEIDTEGDTIDSNDLVKNKVFKVFSNSPSFAYTYAYVFNLYNLLIPEFKDKFDKEILRKEPVNRNTLRMISYEKSLYYCILFLLSKYPYMSNLYDKAKKMNKKEVHERIKNIQKKIIEYNKKKRAYNILKKPSVAVAMKDKIKKELKKQGIQPKSSINHSQIAKSKISGQPKITGRSKKRKITGKKKK